MKHKVIYTLHLLWSAFIAFSFPFCFAWIALDITGHSKGMDYDLGEEKSLSILIGCVELFIWLLLALPSQIYVFVRTKKKGRRYLAVIYAVFVLLAALSIILMGGWSDYLRNFI